MWKYLIFFLKTTERPTFQFSVMQHRGLASLHVLKGEVVKDRSSSINLTFVSARWEHSAQLIQSPSSPSWGLHLRAIELSLSYTVEGSKRNIAWMWRQQHAVPITLHPVCPEKCQQTCQRQPVGSPLGASFISWAVLQMSSLKLAKTVAPFYG